MSKASPAGQTPPWTPKSLLDWSTDYFSGKGIVTAKLDSEMLLAHVLGCSRIDLYLQFDRPLTTDELAAYRSLVRARAGRTPVAYLTGEAGFWNLQLSVGPGCLIPRPDTETLVEVVLEAIDGFRENSGADSPLICLEWGAGCGAIPLAVCGEREHLMWVACELSPQALAYARADRHNHSSLLGPRHNSLQLIRADGFSAISPQTRPHLIVSNPPYIPQEILAGLEPEVSQSEPATALDGGADGLDFHRRLVTAAGENLAPGGRLLLEIGAEQGEALRALLREQDAFELVEIRRDLGGRDRALHAVRR